jgi:PhnB protein
MATGAPDGWPSVIPRLVVHDLAQMVLFLRQTFDATGEMHDERPAVMGIGDSLVMVSGPGPRDPVAGFLYVYVADVDDTYQRALKAGATPLEEPRDQEYGDRRAMVADPCGNMWQIATHLKAR